MSTILIYTSPARGHLFPILGPALELNSQGHEVHVLTLSSEVERVRSLGLNADAIAAAVESREMDDWKAKSPMGAIERAMSTFTDRSVSEVDDLRTAIRRVDPDILVIDTNSWGAQAAAEESNLPWALFQPYFTYLPSSGVPPFGPGLPRITNPAGRVRDALLRKLIFSKLNKLALPKLNGVRADLGLEPIKTITEMLYKPNLVLYFTSKELEYPREDWPEHFRFIGPGLWAPESETPSWLNDTDRDVALVTCSTERQSDRFIVEAALETLPGEGFFVVATSAAYDPSEFDAGPQSNVRLERFIPHEPVVRRAGVVICHGGMGITQRALSHGVPVVIIPFGRDQLEVARRVEYAGAGVRLMPKKLNRNSLQKAVRQAMGKKDRAGHIAESLKAAGNDSDTARLISELKKPVLQRA
jgi:MGT family glycosyltransferase